MSEQSKEVDGAATQDALAEASAPKQNGEESLEELDTNLVDDAAPGSPSAKKKKSKKAKLKKAIGMGSKSEEGESSKSSSNPASKLTNEMIEQLLEMNPSLKGEVAGMSKDKAAEKIKSLDVADILTGMSVSGKNQKDMASYKFWQTQPVPRFDEAPKAEEGPIKTIDPEQVPKEPRVLHEGFEWVTMDLTNGKEIEEVYELLNGHYVEDDDSSFRLSYSASFLEWALKAPGWKKEWHVGVRATKSKKLLAFISGIPIDLRIRSKVVRCAEINWLCVHKKLRNRRLTPILIEEITRRNFIHGIYQAIYTAGVVLPRPVSSCRYFHRPLDWLKLYETGFCALPPNSTKARQITRNHLPSATSIKGLRPMGKKDVKAVQELNARNLKRFELAPEWNEEEVEHWLLHDESKTAEQVIWTYVAEDPSSQAITDFFSFYMLDSSVIGNPKHDSIKAVYMFYYATEKAFQNNDKVFKERVNQLVLDALILAKRFNFDVFNAVTNLDNPFFLEQQKFGRGDGQLHYYLYNYQTPPIAGGVDARNNADETKRGGVGVVMM